MRMWEDADAARRKQQQHRSSQDDSSVTETTPETKQKQDSRMPSVEKVKETEMDNMSLVTGTTFVDDDDGASTSTLRSAGSVVNRGCKESIVQVKSDDGESNNREIWKYVKRRVSKS
ncbi:hypothetical protein MAP00_000309 [Monascus purpureus]|nr:hypothetical protein MAP00_000309 [Monascus purpureus]